MNDTDQTPGSPQPEPAPAAGAVPPYAAPAPMLERDARTMAMLVHIIAAAAMVLSAGTLAFLVPLVMWLVYRERSALIDHHGRLNLNLQLTMLAVIVGGVILGLVTIGLGFIVTIPLMIVYGIYALVMSIIAGVQANNGEYSRIPLVIPFVR
ncbi:DUF4870 domain-containing protein [Demequina sp. SYSU T00039]|uniref:DUF4870 domain-containing protein n=1 Tax=Demequina lignilytica TaxID=3051663 RepID=A0AAW7M828_9MICO|nr:MULTISPECIES: DUF4870 domain-containing protein [unclassified Demequina]MDN4478462.1 DUF4870 domain-containing protein [Demequina sp. SYSU T00039-1]MDN4487031.1 DUF4870 domain-containing protein [Demequina sp. SYSU T00039]MDN4489742.1 DUF4870 domain-containing protein [Demequina sp. SYSU T00068]